MVQSLIVDFVRGLRAWPRLALLLVLASAAEFVCDSVLAAKGPGSEFAASHRLLLIGMTKQPTSDSFRRFNRSAQAYEHDLSVLHTAKLAADAEQRPAHAHGANKLEQAHKILLLHKNEDDLIVMLLLDCDYAIINGDRRSILTSYDELVGSQRAGAAARVLLAADTRCWPNAALADKFGVATAHNTSQTDLASLQTNGRKQTKRFIDSRAVIGPVRDVWRLVDAFWASERTAYKTSADDSDGGGEDDDPVLQFQAFVASKFVQHDERSKYGLRVDGASGLFEQLRVDRASLTNDQQHESEYVSAAEQTAPELPNRVSHSNVELEFEPTGVVMKNRIHATRPLVALATHDMATEPADWPKVLVGVFIFDPTPFIEHLFEDLRHLNYPKGRMHLFVHNSVEYHAKQVANFVAENRPDEQRTAAGGGATNLTAYASLTVSYNAETGQNAEGARLAPPAPAEWWARQAALEHCKLIQCDYYLSVDSFVRLHNRDTLRQLIETNKTLVAPMLSRPKKLWSNFWGSITADGYYARSFDYVDLVARQRLGVWSVPFVSDVYLVEGDFLRRNLAPLLAARHTADSLNQSATRAHQPNVTGAQTHQPDSRQVAELTYYDAKFAHIVRPALLFARNLRRANVQQFVTNVAEFGHLIDASQYNTSRLFPDLYELTNNLYDWERKYVHENYTLVLANAAVPLESPCPDVYWFPIVSDTFCRELVGTMEHFGQWSGGTHSDPRIEGGYESVPTRDIHFKQVGLHDMWLDFLREFVQPIQLKEYVGYDHDPPHTDLAFVVRYHPQEQHSLRPHHDSSTYTINIALNKPGLDYEGGGCRFTRYNCSVVDSRPGWALIHPGRLTHQHEGLRVTRGTRYILVTFVDP